MVAENGGILLECNVLTNTVTTCLDSIVHMENSFLMEICNFKTDNFAAKKTGFSF